MRTIMVKDPIGFIGELITCLCKEVFPLVYPESAARQLHLMPSNSTILGEEEKMFFVKSVHSMHSFINLYLAPPLSCLF